MSIRNEIEKRLKYFIFLICFTHYITQLKMIIETDCKTKKRCTLYPCYLIANLKFDLSINETLLILSFLKTAPRKIFLGAVFFYFVARHYLPLFDDCHVCFGAAVSKQPPFAAKPFNFVEIVLRIQNLFFFAGGARNNFPRGIRQKRRTVENQT